MPTLKALAEQLGAELRLVNPADADVEVRTCARIDEAGPQDISFLANQKYVNKVDDSNALAIIASKETVSEKTNLIIAEDPYFTFRNTVVALHGYRVHPEVEYHKISEQADVHETAVIGENVTIYPFAVICEDVKIGDGSVIYPHTFIGPQAVVGKDCQIYPNVTIYDHCVLGDRVTLHAGTVIGQDGFGYATHQGAHHKIPQIGNVIIEDDVEMGANNAIDRATMGSTIIGKGTKFSDLIAIGHGAHIGAHNLFVAQVGIAGSVNTGQYVVLGGQVGSAGHLEIGDMSQVAAKSGIINDLPGGEKYGGQPARPLNEAKRTLLASLKAPEMAKRIKVLERKLAKLEKALEDQLPPEDKVHD